MSRTFLLLLCSVVIGSAAAIVGPEYGREQFLSLGQTGLSQVTNVSFSLDGNGKYIISTNGVMARGVGTFISTNGIHVGELDMTAYRWVDSAIVFEWPSVGTFAPDSVAVTAPYGGITMLGWADGDKLDFSAQIGHNIVLSNTALFTELHAHVIPLEVVPPTLNRTRLQVIYTAANVNNAFITPITNVVEFQVSTNVHSIVGFGTLSNTVFFPRLSAMYVGTITRLAAGASNFTGRVHITGDIHYPVDRLGSSSDRAE